MRATLSRFICHMNSARCSCQTDLICLEHFTMVFIIRHVLDGRAHNYKVAAGSPPLKHQGGVLPDSMGHNLARQHAMTDS